MSAASHDATLDGMGTTPVAALGSGAEIAIAIVALGHRVAASL